MAAHRHRQRPLLRPDHREGHGAHPVHQRAEVPGHAARSTGRRTARRSSPSASRSEAQFGMFRWRSKKPFSPEKKDWGKGKLVTDTSKSRRGRARRGGLDPTASALRWSPTRAAGRSRLPGEARRPADDQREEHGRARLQARWRQRRQGALRSSRPTRSATSRTARSSASRSTTQRRPGADRVHRRQPGVPAAPARAVAMLCPSCRRQLDRGAGFCLGCGMPVRPGMRRRWSSCSATGRGCPS